MTELKKQQDTALPMGCTQEQIDALGAEETPRCCGTCRHWLCPGIDPDGIGVCRHWLGRLNYELDYDPERHVNVGWILLCACTAAHGGECEMWGEYR